MAPVPQIVIVEGSETQAQHLRYLLEGEGWEVIHAATGELALDELNRHLPALLIVDYHLPGMRGDEFCRRVRMNSNTRATPILMLTDSGEREGFESGADGYVSKFGSLDILFSRIRALLGRAPQDTALNALDAAIRNARILTIDDSATYLAYLSEELRNQGYEAESAKNGAEGLARLALQNFDCVLVDLVMSGMDGIEVCGQITAKYSSMEKAPAVIVLTGSENKGEMNRAFEAGADDFVSKSSDLAVLYARIEAVMRRRFLQGENRRVVAELKARELETLHAHAGRQMAEARVAMAEKLVQANQDLQDANRRLNETQAQLIHNEKMASLGQLVAGIAHEINNPLAFVVNNLFIVESGLDALGVEMESHLPAPSLGKLRKARSRLGEMGEGLNRVKELVLNLRTFSRLDAGEFRTVDVVEIIDAVLLLLKHKMGNRICVEKNCVPPHSLYCHAGRLNQVLMNLIANAIDAIVGKGTIFITTSQTHELFLISVRDTGAGIAEAIRSKIFDPFFTTKAVGQGTGLGLSISYGIVQDHGGSIEVESEEGVGTEFVVKIPLDLKLRGK